MSSESSVVSRPPQSNSAPDGTDADTAEQVSDERPDLSDLPDPSEKVREFLDELGERAHLPISMEHGRDLRAECVEKEYAEYEVDTGDGGTDTEEEVRNVFPAELWQVVADMLEWHADYHRSTLRLEYGQESDPTHELLDVPLDNSWMAAYQDKERARLKAMERQTCGYQTCEKCDTRWCQEQDEHATEYVEGEFERPFVVLTGRTAAGDGRPPVDHARGIAEAWTGPNGNDGAGRSLRYILAELLGLESDEWVRWTQGEPHTGKRAGAGFAGNRGYHHAHDIIILDGAATEEEVRPSMFRTLMEAHVEKCDHAGHEANTNTPCSEHYGTADTAFDSAEPSCDDCDTAVSVKEVEEDIEESVASYAAAYLANESKDLLERSPEYLMWAATMWATGTQKGIKSDSANHAIAADQCHHKHANDDQEIPHAAEVRRSNCRCVGSPGPAGCARCGGRGYHVVCTMCGSPWSVEQEQTLTAHRTADGGHATVADGGAEPAKQTPAERREEELRDRWPSAREAASVGGEARERDGERVNDGNVLEGRRLRLGGDVSFCMACGERDPDPDGRCPAESDRSCSGECRGVSKYAIDCASGGLSWSDPCLPAPSCECSDRSGHRILEPSDRRDGGRKADVTVTTECDQYRGTGHVPFEYEEPPNNDGVTAGFRRPPSWSAKAVIRNGEELPASGGGVDMVALDLPSAPVRVAAMATDPAGEMVCQQCKVTFRTVSRYVEHGCDGGHVHVAWLPDTDPPAEETTLSRKEFIGVVPDGLLDKSDPDPSQREPVESAGPEWPRQQVEEYVENHPDVSTAAAMGRFNLPPGAWEAVEEVRR